MTKARCEKTELSEERASVINFFFKLITHELILFCFIGACAAGPVTQDAQAIIKASLLKGGDSYEPDPRYLFTLHKTESELDRFGNTTSVDTETFEVSSLYGRRCEQLVARNNKPLSGIEKTAEIRKLDKQISEGRLHPQGDTREDKGKQQRKQMMAEVPNAFQFTLKGTEMIRGRSAFVISVNPRADFHSANPMAAKIFPVISGTVWIDQETGHWARIRAKIQDTIRFGFILATVAEGSSIEMEDVLVNGEAWMPSSFIVRYDARIGLVKHLHRQEKIQCGNYRKFEASSQVTFSNVK